MDKSLLNGSVAHERQISNNHGSLVATSNAGRVIGDVPHGNWQRGVMALQDHSQGVPNQEHLHARPAGRLREGRVVSGQHGDLLATRFQCADTAQRHRS